MTARPTCYRRRRRSSPGLRAASAVSASVIGISSALTLTDQALALWRQAGVVTSLQLGVSFADLPAGELGVSHITALDSAGRAVGAEIVLDSERRRSRLVRRHDAARRLRVLEPCLGGVRSLRPVLDARARDRARARLPRRVRRLRPASRHAAGWLARVRLAVGRRAALRRRQSPRRLGLPDGRHARSRSSASCRRRSKRRSSAPLRAPRARRHRCPRAARRSAATASSTAGSTSPIRRRRASAGRRAAMRRS